MKLHSVLLGHLLLGTSHALSALDGRDEANSSLPSTGSSITWSECDLGEAINAELDAFPEKSQCAKLEVPLDYTNLSSGETIELQLIKVSANKEPFKGSILYNPGGPGASGVLGVLGNLGLTMRDVVGGHYDIIGFDPRGIGRTIPFSCNVTGPPERPVRRRDFDSSALTQADIWPLMKELIWDPSEATATACFEQQAKYGRFVGTTFVARDMISIVDALDQGPKLNYWGASYGTVLGQVFASMFPERVGRVMLEGNLPAEDYARTTWISGARDGDRSLYKVYEECVDAGPELCALADYAGDNTTADDLRTAVNEAIEDKLRENTEGKEFGASAVSLAKYYLIQQLYGVAGYDGAVERLTHILTGNWTAAVTPVPSMLINEWNQASHALQAIACSDSSFRAENLEDLYSMYRAHVEQSQFSDAILTARLNCARWRFEAAEKIDLNALRNIKTSSPVLVVNSRWDPVTSLSAAWEVSSQLRNSRVITHHGVGHSFRSHVSNCTNNAVREYFDEGKMPELGLTCEPEMNAFEYVAWLTKQASGQ